MQLRTATAASGGMKEDEQGEAGDVCASSICGGDSAVLNEAIGERLTRKMAFEQRPGGGSSQW